VESEYLVQHGEEIWRTTRNESDLQYIWRTKPGENSAPYYKITASSQFDKINEIHETETMLWIRASNKILLLTKNTADTDKDLLRIQSVVRTLERDKTVLHFLEDRESIPFRKSALTINLGHSRFLLNENLMYRYKLSHYQDEWSPWTRAHSFTFKDLHERDYIFEAQCMSSYGLLSDIESFHFTVTPPPQRK